jgi:AsmA-like protein
MNGGCAYIFGESPNEERVMNLNNIEYGMGATFTALRRRRAVLIVFALILIVAAILLSIVTRMTPNVRQRAVTALNERFKSDVDLASLQVSIFPRPEILGTGLVLRHQGRRDVAPLIKIGSYSASAGLWGLIHSPLHLKTVALDRLEISIPPGGVHGNLEDPSVEGEATATAKDNDGPSVSKLVIDQIVSRTATLDIVPRDSRKLPRRFEIHNLVMRGLGERDGARFEATLTNPTPRGEIGTRGTFGPWQADDPSQTPVHGEYTFKSANLNTIKGIGGMLSSVGKYSGVLERIEVTGETDTPDFSIDIAAQPVPLTTRFHAIVDGTNGDTTLERVEARVIETLIVARGAVLRNKDVKGRRISLDVAIDDGRIEDVLKLAVKATKPVMSGRMQLKAKLLLPAGDDRAVIDKLDLSGTFRLNEARFSNVNVQEKINALSQRGKGDESAGTGPSVVSRLSGTFTLKDGTLTFSDLSFGVPGAIVQIAGTYDVKQETLDFRGNLLLDATLAETTSGWKAVVGRIAQPLFRRQGGGSKLPIRISGPRQQPKFGLDVGRALGPG